LDQLATRPAGAAPAAERAVMPAQGRLEYKFIVPKEQLAALRADLLPYVLYDEFCAARPGHEYTVRSVYYDTRSLACYFEKVDGFRLKKKLRIRGYNTPTPDSRVFLEIKSKQEDFIAKSRVGLRWDEVRGVFADHRQATARPFPSGSPQEEAFGRFMHNYLRYRMLPSALVAYEREAFVGRFDPMLRLTLDRNVRSRLYPALGSLYEDREMKFLVPGHFIFEVKFYMRLPHWVRDLIRRFDLTRLAFSKYATGIEVHRREKKLWLGIAHTVEFATEGRPM
jgi:hypothetical protein